MLGCLMVMAEFIFTTASFSLKGRPRMAGPGVSTMYQYDFTLSGVSTRAIWLPSDGSSECTIKRNMGSIVCSELGVDMIKASG